MREREIEADETQLLPAPLEAHHPRFDFDERARRRHDVQTLVAVLPPVGVRWIRFPPVVRPVLR
jgi:hypothetical protein